MPFFHPYIILFFHRSPSIAFAKQLFAKTSSYGLEAKPPDAASMAWRVCMDVANIVIIYEKTDTCISFIFKQTNWWCAFQLLFSRPLCQTIAICRKAVGIPCRRWEGPAGEISMAVQAQAYQNQQEARSRHLRPPLWIHFQPLASWKAGTTNDIFWC